MPVTNLDALLERADRALYYRGKREGRNQVCVADRAAVAEIVSLVSKPTQVAA